MTVQLRQRDRWDWEALFPAVRELRPMRIVLDAAVLQPGSDATELLLALWHRQGVQGLLVGEKGAPSTVRRVTPPRSDRSYPIGWIEAVPKPDQGFTTHSVTWATDEGVTHGAIRGNGVGSAGRDVGPPAYVHLPAEAAAARRRADMVVLLGADATRADVLVTERPYLLQRRTSLAPGVAVAGLRDALGLVGLYLRHRGDFVVAAAPDGSGAMRLDKGLYNWVGARELLPAGWRWFSSCVAARDPNMADALTGLGGACLQRVARTLHVRHDVLVALNQRQSNDQADDVAAGLDTCLVFLMGSVDAAARVAHHVLELKGRVFEAGWQRPKWLSAVRKACPQLADVVADGTPQAHALTVLRLLRNSIHDEGMSTLASVDSRRRQETLLQLPPAAVDELLTAMDALGGRVYWGVRDVVHSTGSIYADPGMLLELTLAHTVELLNQLMEQTSFAAVTDAGQGLLEPPGEDDPVFSPTIRRNVRLLLGL